MIGPMLFLSTLSDTWMHSDLFFTPLPPSGAYQFFTHFVLFLFRIMPILTQFTPFGANILPFPVRIAFAISLFALFFPYLWLNSNVEIFFNSEFVLLMLKEAFMGLIIGFFLALPYWIAQTAGMFVDFQRGSSSLSAHDPALQTQSSPIGLLYNQTMILVFYYFNGLAFILYALLESYRIIPIDLYPNAQFLASPTPTYWFILCSLLGRVTALFCQISAPPVVAVLLGDMFLGIANRLAPQVQISFLGMSLKSLLGILLMFLSWQLMISQMSKELSNWHLLFDRWIHMMYT